MHLRLWTVVSALVIGVGCGAAAGQGPERAPVLFADNCGPCHGTDGSGNADIAAPAIAGLPGWYVEAQLVKFRDGIRGAHAEDYEGLRMRPMARTLPADDVAGVAAYVGTLPSVAPSRAITGDAARGAKLYATCAACHGPDGKGMEALKSPPIVQLDDWYIASQIHKFKSGIRGSNTADVTGMQMRPMAATLADDQAVHDVIAHLATLGG